MREKVRRSLHERSARRTENPSEGVLIVGIHRLTTVLRNRASWLAELRRRLALPMKTPTFDGKHA
jgi:hypothetical protein